MWRSGQWWVTVAECCCVFNLCYTFDDEADDSAQELLMANEMRGIDTAVPLSTREADELFALPPHFDPMQAYYDLYEFLPGTDTQHSASSPRDSPRVTEDAVLQALKVLGSQTADAPEVSRAFTFLLLAIRATEKGSEKREEYIRQCHYYRDVYSRDDTDDAAHAAAYAREVAPQNRHRNKKHMNLLCFQKAIYYTHNMTAKLALIDQYSAYCAELGWHQ